MRVEGLLRRLGQGRVLLRYGHLRVWGFDGLGFRPWVSGFGVQG
jgi:hypothetical protein